MPWNHPSKIPADHLARLQRSISSEPVFRWVLDQICSRNELDDPAQAWLDAFFPGKDLSALLPALPPHLQILALNSLPADYFQSSTEWLTEFAKKEATGSAGFDILMRIAPKEINGLVANLSFDQLGDSLLEPAVQFLRFYTASRLPAEGGEFASFDKAWREVGEINSEFVSLAMARPDARKYILHRHPDTVFEILRGDAVDLEDLPEHLESMLESLGVHQAWYLTCSLMRDDRIVPNHLPLFLSPEAPLPVVGKLLGASDQKFLQGAVTFAIGGAERTCPGLTLLLNELTKRPKFTGEKASMFGAFALALGMHCWQRDTLRDLPILETLEILETDAPLHDHPLFEELLDRLGAGASQEDVARLLELCEDDEYCTSNIALAMARAEPEESVDRLVDAWLCDEDGISRIETELLHLGASFEIPIIKACADELPGDIPLDILAMSGDDATVELLLESWPRMRVADLGMWTYNATLLADHRLLAVLEEDLDRANECIDVTCVKLAAVFGLTGEQYDAALKRSNERLDLVRGKNARDVQALPLTVFCDTCFFENELIVSRVDVTDDPVDPYVMPSPPPCPQCGAEDSLQLTESACDMLDLFHQAVAEAMKDGEPYEGLLHFKHGFSLNTDFDNSEETVAFAERWLARDPDNVPAMTLLMLELGREGDTDNAAALARRIVKREPLAADANFLLLLDAMERRDFSGVHALADRLLPEIENWTSCFDSGAEVQLEIMLHEARKIPRPKPTNVISLHGSSGTGELLTSSSESHKPLPNEPCPCGSGRKFKKCCGRTV